MTLAQQLHRLHPLNYQLIASIQNLNRFVHLATLTIHPTPTITQRQHHLYKIYNKQIIMKKFKQHHQRMQQQRHRNELVALAIFLVVLVVAIIVQLVVYQQPEKQKY